MIFEEISILIIDDIIKTSIIINEIILCLKIEIFIFSFLLSFTIDVYNFMLLTPKIIIAGMNIAFWRNIVINTNIIPFTFPSVNIQDAIV